MYQPGTGAAKAEGQEAEETSFFFMTLCSEVSSRVAICLSISFITQTSS